MAMGHNHHDSMGMGGCMECMRMGNGGASMGGMNGMSQPAAQSAGAKTMTPTGMRMSGGRSCGC
jgi:hypothetical protein